MVRPIRVLLLCSPLLGIAARWSPQAPPAPAELRRRYDTEILPLLQTYCVRCHGAEEVKGDLRLDRLKPELSPKNIPLWTRVRNVLDVGEMPPKSAKRRPNREEQERILNWIGASFKRFEADNQSSQGDTLIRRINMRAYANMMQSLLGVPAQGLDEFPADGTVHGYDTVGSGLYTNAYLYDLYLRCAQRTLDVAVETAPQAPEPKTHAIVSGPFFKKRTIDRAKNIERAIKNLLEDPVRFVHLDMFAGGATVGGLNFNTLIGGHYQKKTLQEVLDAGIDWTHDEACRDKVAAALKDVVEQFRLDAEQFDDFQPPQDDLRFTVPSAGVYSISTRLCVTNAAVPLPVRLTATHASGTIDYAASFMVYGSRAQPDDFEAKAFLQKGTYVIRLRSEATREYIKELFGVLPTPPYGPIYAFKDGLLSNQFKAAVPVEEQKKAFPNVMIVLREHLTARGPIHDTWPPASTARLFPRGLHAAATRDYAEEIVLTFMKRAYAGDCDAEAAQPYVDLVLKHFDARKDFVQAVKFGLTALLSSPRFLYLSEEQRSDAGSRRPLTGFELARRLAYFLWSDLPDDALLASASSGALLKPGELSSQVRRMLQDERSRAFSSAFTLQWLKIDKLNGITVSNDLFPDYDPYLVDSAARESIAFFSDVLGRDRSILNFIDSNYAMLNDRMALHYKIPGVRGGDFRRVDLPADAHRGGVLTQASVLLATSNGMVSSPVKRGVFILDRILGRPPGAPPPNVPALDHVQARNPDGSLRTPLERLAEHRTNISCARCHDRIDPLGAGLETFNALGAWNEKLRLLIPDAPKGKPKWADHAADLRGTLPDGTPFDGPEELKQRILQHQDEFERCFVEQLMTYALGRTIELSDRPALDRILAGARNGKDGLATLVEEVVQSELFRAK